VSAIVDRILGLPGWLVLLVAGLVVLAEDALFVGFVLPGETVALLAGAASRIGNAPLAGVLAVVIAAAVVGDTIGYEVGRHLGTRVLGLRFFHRHQERLDAARGLLVRRAGSAVFLGRWIAFFRAVMPFLAGASRMHYPIFLRWNALGGIAWGATVVLVGYAAGASYARVETSFGRGVAVAVVAVLVIAVVVWRVRRHRARLDR
jgi:membrane protein DedA with SNARE-associated domain